MSTTVNKLLLLPKIISAIVAGIAVFALLVLAGGMLAWVGALGGVMKASGFLLWLGPLGVFTTDDLPLRAIFWLCVANGVQLAGWCFTWYLMRDPMPHGERHHRGAHVAHDDHDAR